MEENNAKTPKKIFTPANILRILALLVMILVFCPAFLVSCGGEKITVSAFEAFKGFEYEGRKMAEPQWSLVLCLLLPALVTVLLSLRKKRIGNLTTEKVGQICGGAVLGLSLIDLILWIKFREAVALEVEKFSIVKSTGWYTLNIILLVLIMLIAGLAALRLWEMETDIRDLSFGKAKQLLKSGVAKISGGHPASAQTGGAARKCTACGTPLTDDSRFCTTCGAPIPVSQASKVCTGCGKPLPENARFCVSCGTPVPPPPVSQAPKVCTGCGKPLPEDARFCVSCGTPVPPPPVSQAPKVCTGCGKPLPEEARFCVSCGTPVAGKN